MFSQKIMVTFCWDLNNLPKDAQYMFESNWMCCAHCTGNYFHAITCKQCKPVFFLHIKTPSCGSTFLLWWGCYAKVHNQQKVKENNKCINFHHINTRLYIPFLALDSWPCSDAVRCLLILAEILQVHLCNSVKPTVKNFEHQ